MNSATNVLDPVRQAAHHHAQLGRVLERASRSPFYRERSGRSAPRSVEEFFDSELTTKDDLRDAYPFGMLAVPQRALATYHESSGTSGRPTASYYTAADWTDLAERYARKWVGITAEDVFLVRTPYALMITGHLAHAAARSRGATVVPADSRSSATPPARVARLLRDLDVSLTWSNPTEALLWAAAAREQGTDPGSDFPALRALFVGGEPLAPRRRRRIEEIWDARVVEEYGSTETGTLAGQCPAGELHLWSDRILFEVYDPATGSVSWEGRGQLVATPLYREAMPLLRYNLADLVEVSWRPCPCGSTMPTVTVLGRAGWPYRVGGVAVTQRQVEEIVFGLPGSHQVWFWRARAEHRALRLEFEVPEERRADALGALGRALDTTLGVRHELRAVRPGTLVSRELLTADPDVLKPRGLFGPDEDWDSALTYY